MYYRGADINSLNADEFRDNTIDGHYVHVTEVDFPPDVRRENWQAQGVYNFEQYVTDSRDVPITGGLTDNLPAAIKFTKSADPPGVVLFLDSSKIIGEVTAIEYDIEWFDNNPGALAHVDTLNDGELREGGEIIGMLDSKDGNWYVREYGRDRAENTASRSTYESESEAIAFTDEIGLDGSIRNLATYAGTTGVSPYTLYNYANNITSYMSGLARLQNRDLDPQRIDAEDYRTQAEVVYDAMVDIIQYPTEDYHIVAVESMNDVHEEEGRVTPENFRFVYNGRDFDESYERNSHLLGGR